MPCPSEVTVRTQSGLLKIPPVMATLGVRPVAAGVTKVNLT